MKKENAGHVLIVDDEEAIRESLTELLEVCDFHVVTADCYKSAVKVLESDEKIESVICDLKMPGESGHSVLKYINKCFPQIPLIFLTGYGTMESCQKAVKDGAYDYILKPVESKDKVVLPLKHAVEKHRIEKKNKEMQIDIIRMAEEHQGIIESLLTDSDMKEQIQEKITTILEKWE